jgi:hypothetical protein
LRLGIHYLIGKSTAHRPTSLLGYPRVTLGLQGKPALTRGYIVSPLRGSGNGSSFAAII